VFRGGVEGTLIFDKTHDRFDIAAILDRIGQQAPAGQPINPATPSMTRRGGVGAG
jgi:hypothetical protein